jgi:hypothetical protein
MGQEVVTKIEKTEYNNNSKNSMMNFQEKKI